MGLAAQTETSGSAPRSGRTGLILVVLALMALRLPLLTGPANLSPDACEYIDIARNVAAGEGLSLGIRAYFLGDGLGLPYPAMSLRSPLFPVLMGGCYALAASDGIFRWFNSGVFLANILLLGLLVRPYLRPGLFPYALLLMGLAEPMILTSVFPWAEQTALFWLLLALWMAARDLHGRWGAAGAALEGFAAALAGLSRPEYALAAAILLFWLARPRKGRLAVAASFLCAWLIPFLVVAAFSLQHYGRTFLPGDYLFRSRQYAAYFAWDAGGATGAGAFLSENWFWIAGRVLRNAANYLVKLAGWKNLFALTVALPLVLAGGWRALRKGEAVPLALVPALFFLAYCLVWGGIDRERYLLPVTTLLLPLCLAEADRRRIVAHTPLARRAWAAAMFAGFPLLLANTLQAGWAVQSRPRLAERFYAAPNPAWENPDFERLAAWVERRTREGDVLCLENPFLINYRTRRPAVVLPEQIGPADFARFLAAYGVRYWIDNAEYTKRPRPDPAELERAVLASGGALAGVAGSYRIWKTGDVAPGR